MPPTSTFDWITAFLDATADIPSPRNFRLWAAIMCLAGALERRIYTKTRATRPAYPNLFVCLSGESGSGKTEAINVARDLWLGIEKFHISPDNLTNAAFYDALKDALRTHMNGSGAAVYSALTVCSPELGVLMPKYDMQFLSDLSHIYDNQNTFISRRRDAARTVEIDRPTVNILAGVTPRALGDIMPELAWGQGFASRMLFIHGHTEKSDDIDWLRPRHPLNIASLRPRLEQVWELSGEVTWSDEAHDALYEWYNFERETTNPQHGRLREYCTRRHIHLMKLSMISAVSAGRDLEVTLGDFSRAQSWLFSAETVMPDVFRAMGAKSDRALIDEMHYHIYTEWTKRGSNGKRAPVKEAEIVEFFSERAESHRIKSLIEVAVMSGVIRKGQYIGEYIPRPLDKHLTQE